MRLPGAYCPFRLGPCLGYLENPVDEKKRGAMGDALNYFIHGRTLVEIKAIPCGGPIGKRFLSAAFGFGSRGSSRDGRGFTARHALFDVGEKAVDLIRDNDSVIDGAQPSRHDNANRPGVKETHNLAGKIHGDIEALEFRAERGSTDMPRIMVNGSWGCCFEVIDLLANIRYQTLERGYRLFAETFLFSPVILFGQA